MILCSGITAATYKVLDISLELDAIFEKRFATKIGELYVEQRWSHTKVILIHYQTLSQKDTT